MKKLVYLIFWITPMLAYGQNKNYVLVEHFTNTPCPICASNNPKIYNVIDQHIGEIHHISIHTDSPYPSCELHNFNAPDNKARQSFYGVLSTPRVYVNGKVSSASQQAIFEQDVQEALANDLPLSIAVEEGTGRNRKVQVQISSNVTLEAADYRIFVAITEGLVNYSAPNGEKEHRDVLRDYVTSADGDPFTAPLRGESMTLSYDIAIPAGVADQEAFVLVYVQNNDTREILGSGTRFDETATTSALDLSTKSGLQAFPNPVSDVMEVSVANGFEIESYDLLSINGSSIKRVALDHPTARLTIETRGIPTGNYILDVQMAEGNATLNFVKK